MDTLVVEVACQLCMTPSDGLTVTIVRRVRDNVIVGPRWTLKQRTVSTSELEDIVNQWHQALMDHLLIGPGVQLALHD